MTAEERRDILAAMHQLELSVIERLARLEEKVHGQHVLKQRIDDLERVCAVETQISRDRSNRLLVGLVLVAVIALGDGVLRVAPLL